MKFFTAFPDNWLAGTGDLTAEAVGAYWLICCFYMSKDGDVPDDDQKNARIARLSTRGWRQIKATLIDGGYIEVRDGFLYQSKCEERLKKDGVFSRSQRGKAQKRWQEKRTKALKRNDTADAPACAPDLAGGDASPIPQYSSSSKKGAEVAPTDQIKLSRNRLWTWGREFLKARSVPGRSIDSLLGRWQREVGPVVALRLLEETEHKAGGDPTNWMQAAVAAERESEANPSEIDRMIDELRSIASDMSDSASSFIAGLGRRKLTEAQMARVREIHAESKDALKREAQRQIEARHPGCFRAMDHDQYGVAMAQAISRVHERGRDEDHAAIDAIMASIRQAREDRVAA